MSIDKVEIFLEQREVAFLLPSKICENLNFSRNSNFRKFCWVIRTQPISFLKLFRLYLLYQNLVIDFKPRTSSSYVLKSVLNHQIGGCRAKIKLTSPAWQGKVQIVAYCIFFHSYLSPQLSDPKQ